MTIHPAGHHLRSLANAPHLSVVADTPEALEALWPTQPVVIDSLMTVELPTYNGEPMLPPPPVGVATYDVRRRWAPTRHLGFAVGGAIACLVPLAYAIADILGGAA